MTQWGMDLAIRNLVDGFDMAIGRHFSAPVFYAITIKRYYFPF